MKQRNWLELLKDYDANIQYHPGKANVVADTLSRKSSGSMACLKIQLEIIKDLELMEFELVVRGYEGYVASLKIEPNLILWIKEAQKDNDELWIMLQNLKDGRYQIYSDASKKGLGCVHMQDSKVIAYASRQLKPYERNWLELLKDYDVNIQYHPGKANVVADTLSRKSSGSMACLKIQPEIIKDLELMEFELVVRGYEGYVASLKIEPNLILWIKDLKQNLWWNGMKHDVARFVAKCLTCQQIKIDHQRASGLLQALNIPTWKWEKISMDFVTGLPRTFKNNDAFWVMVDRSTKSAYFFPIRKGNSVSKLAEIIQ
nr:hypothetical protein [Tanacetum cinerariifolium]